MDYTKNLQLGKPRDEEYYSVDVFNHNADLIDEAVSTHKHAAGDITSGVLSPERGGTGQDSLNKITVGNADTVDGKHASDFALQSWTASQLAGKADLELAKYDRFNQYPAFTAQNIFANPPLQVLPVGIHYFCFDGELPGAPLPGNRYWSITIDKPSINADRVIQFARQIYASTDIQAIFFRMRHVDNNDFTQWQPWQRVATTDSNITGNAATADKLVSIDYEHCLASALSWPSGKATILDAVIAMPNKLLPYASRNASDAPPGVGTHYGEVIGIGDPLGYGLTVFWFTNMDSGQWVRTVSGNKWQTSWQRIATTDSSITGNAATATKFQTARKINGVSFDGSKDITVTAAANGGNADTVDGSHAWQMQTLNSSGNPHGPSSWVATIKYNVSGDGRFKLFCGDESIQTKVDYADAAYLAHLAGAGARGNYWGQFVRNIWIHVDTGAAGSMTNGDVLHVYK